MWVHPANRFRSEFYLFLSVFELLLSLVLALVLKSTGMPYFEAVILVPGVPAVMGTVILMTKTEYNY